MKVTLRFFRFNTVNLAATILTNNDVAFQIGANPLDLHFFSELDYQNALSGLAVAQIWPHMSFKGEKDFEVIA
jgi:hypothetical protein